MKIILTESQLKRIISEQTVIINEDMLRLRTLTMKSVWDITEKYKGTTVDVILDIHPSTIYWAYCKVQWANFTPDILEILSQKFSRNFKPIEKPGTDLEQFQEYLDRKGNLNDKTIPELKKLVKVLGYNKKSPNLELLNIIKDKEREYYNTMRRSNPTKVFMQAKNHGKR
jgi:hypothetical protein